jgi:hypothetical protein
MGGNTVLSSFIIMTLLSGLGVIIAPIVVIVKGGGWENAVKCGMLFCSLLLLCFANMMRQLAVTAKDELQRDTRQPVLYIRPFASEEHVFAQMCRKGILRYLPMPEKSSWETGIQNANYQTFGAFFSVSVRKTIGPMIALGSLWDKLPSADGAAREYCDDETWQARFLELAKRASLILASANMSENLNLELKIVLQNGMAGKLFICTAPDLGDKVGVFVLRAWGFLFGHDALALWGLIPKPWGELSQQLVDAGYTPPKDDPGPGAVLACRRDGNMGTVWRLATTPEQYLEAMKAVRVGNIAV